MRQPTTTALRRGFTRLLVAFMACSLVAACSSGDDDNTAAEDDAATTAPVIDAPGVTEDAIRIGLFTVDTGALNDVAEGVAGGDGDVAQGSIDASQDAVIAYINEQGGIAGRLVEPVYYKLNAQNLATPEGRAQEAQAACARWTEDNEVFAFVAFEDVHFECAAASDAVAVSGVLAAPTVSDARAAELGELWYSSTNFTAERREQAMAAFLLDQDFFGDDARVALLIQDNPARRAGVDGALRPALADAGIEPVLEIAYSDPIASPWPNYVLQLQEADVTHVVFSGTSGSFFPPMSMMRAAEDQKFRPAWALASDLSPDGLITVGQTPPEQLENLLGMGWVPALDIGDSTGQGSNGERCDEILTDAGEDPSAGRSTCELLLLLASALEDADAVTSATLAEGVRALGDAFGSPSTIDGATWFGDDRHDGVAVVRAVSFDPAEPGHLRYSSEPIKLDALLGEG